MSGSFNKDNWKAYFSQSYLPSPSDTQQNISGWPNSTQDLPPTLAENSTMFPSAGGQNSELSTIVNSFTALGLCPSLETKNDDETTQERGHIARGFRLMEAHGIESELRSARNLKDMGYLWSESKSVPKTQNNLGALCIPSHDRNALPGLKSYLARSPDPLLRATSWVDGQCAYISKRDKQAFLDTFQVHTQVQQQTGFLLDVLPADSPTALAATILKFGRAGANDAFKPTNIITNPTSARENSSRGPNQDPNIPDHLNCAVFIVGIHPEVTHKEILAAIRTCGKVYSCWINPPIPPKHLSCASKTVFTTRQGAEAFMNQAHSQRGIVIKGQRVGVIWNRIKHHQNRQSEQSRVLGIRGPARYVNCEFLAAYFNRLFLYHTCDVREGPVGQDGHRVVEWEFGSILAQSNAAQMAIAREPMLKDLVTVHYLPDPCE